MVLANLKKRDKSALIVFIVIVITIYVILLYTNYFLYYIVKYISMGFDIYIGNRKNKDILL